MVLEWGAPLEFLGCPGLSADWPHIFGSSKLLSHFRTLETVLQDDVVSHLPSPVLSEIRVSVFLTPPHKLAGPPISPAPPLA